MKRLIYILLIFSTFTVSAQSKGKPVYREKKYPNGKLMYKGNFLNNKPVGEFLRFYPNGKLKAKMNYIDQSVYTSAYNEKGNLIAKGKYLNKKKDSTWTYYKANRIVGQEEYKNGNLEGKMIKYFANGNIADSKQYKAGKKNGKWERFYINGKIMCSGLYKNDRLNGKFSAYSISGKKDIYGFFKNNLKEGFWSYYDSKGKVKFTIEYRDGMPKDKDKVEKMNQEDILLLKNTEKNFIDPQKYIENPQEYLIKRRQTGNN